MRLLCAQKVPDALRKQDKELQSVTLQKLIEPEQSSSPSSPFAFAFAFGHHGHHHPGKHLIFPTSFRSFSSSLSFAFAFAFALALRLLFLSVFGITTLLTCLCSLLPFPLLPCLVVCDFLLLCHFAARLFDALWLDFLAICIEAWR